MGERKYIPRLHGHKWQNRVTREQLQLQLQLLAAALLGLQEGEHQHLMELQLGRTWGSSVAAGRGASASSGAAGGGAWDFL